MAHQYKEWMNARVYALCASLPDAELHRDRGAFFKSPSETWLAEPLTYASKIDGKTRTRTVPKRVLVTHMFNHQTHHRGQVTTLLSQMGLDVGTTDIPFMSQFQAQTTIRRST